MYLVNKPPNEPPDSESPRDLIVDDNPHWFLGFLRGLVELSVAFGLWWLVYYQFYEAVRRSHGQELSIAGVFVSLLAFCAGAVAAIIFYRIVHARWRFRTWLFLNVLVIGAIMIGLVRPLAKEDALHQEKVARQHRIDANDDRRYAAWVDQLKLSTNHGSPGVVPPMLKVEDNGTAIQVQNLAEKLVTVALGRVRQDSTAPGDWKRCGAYADSPDNSRYEGISLNPGEITIFRLYENCAEQFKSAPIEYRVGGWRAPYTSNAADIGWWSDSAFTAAR